MSPWQKAVSGELQSWGVDAGALFEHLAKASHMRRPGETWREQVRAMLPGPPAIAHLLRPFTPAGKRRPTSKDTPAVFGAIWAAPELPSADVLRVVSELVPWCQKELGTSHQAATVGAMVLGVWPDDTKRILEKFRDDASMKSLIATIRASLRKQTERHP